MPPTCYHAIKLPLDIQRPNENVDREWVQKRIEYFIRYTLQSLREQTSQDFKIWIFGNALNHDLHRSYDELKDCLFVYDQGQKITATLSEDFLLLTRLDSDDLFHCDAIAEVRRKVQLSGGMEFLVWRQHYVWDTRNAILGTHFHESPPFVTQVFPKEAYRNTQKFVDISWVHHGKLGGRRLDAVELDPYKVCITKHNVNMSILRTMRKKGQAELDPLISTGVKKRLFQMGRLTSIDPVEIKEILQEFGVHA